MVLFEALTEEGVETSELTAKVGKEVVGVGMGPNMKNKWAAKKGARKCYCMVVALPLSYSDVSATF
jgi:hypothetical protein